jgi:hypothetical protein
MFQSLKWKQVTVDEEADTITAILFEALEITMTIRQDGLFNDITMDNSHQLYSNLVRSYKQRPLLLCSMVFSQKRSTAKGTVP